MADLDQRTDAEQAPARSRRGVDLLTLFFGLATLFASAYVITDGSSWLPSIDLKWVLAGGALVIGTLMLIASTRNRS